MAALSLAADARAELIEATREAEVQLAPRKGRKPRGVVAPGARFEVLERARGRNCKGEWLRIDERAWLCSAFARPVDAAAPQAAPAMPSSYVVTRDVPYFDSLKAAVAGRARRKLPGIGGYRYAGEETAGGKRFLRVDGGWVPADQAQVVSAIPFHGVKLPGDANGKRLAFVGPRDALPVDVAGQPIAGAPPLPAQSWLGEVGAPIKLGKRRLVPIGGDRHLRADDVRLLSFAQPPPGLAAGEHWVDVDLTQQTLVAWEGERPSYATLVSTAKTTTPVGLFRIEKKRPHARMQSRPHYRRKWDTDAPWVISIKGRIAMHAAYWHTEYGTPRSMGCVNLSPTDAQWLWEFTSPAVPPGWLRLEADRQDRPTLVRIRRSRRDR